MKKTLLTLAAALTVLTAPAVAAAHPLGNFTVNRYSGIEVAGSRVYVNYILDMAEVPAFQERQRIVDQDAWAAREARRIARGLTLRLNDEDVRLRPLGQAVGFPRGVAGLRTLRLQVVYASPELGRASRPVALAYRDRNFADRIGWKEIVVRATGNARVEAATVPAASISEELLAYPKDLLQSPLDVTSAEASAVVGGSAGAPPRLLSTSELEAGVAVRAASDGGFASLVAKEDLSVGFVLISLLVALFWGAVHAFSPGHGKAIVAGYLIGSRGTPRHAFALGGIVTVTHTIGVFALGLATLALSEFIVPEQLYPWLNLVSAFLVLAVGLTILRWRVRAWRRGGDASGGAHSHAHGEGHSHAHGGGHSHHAHTHGHAGSHSHGHDPEGARRGLLGIGISAGIIPCPTALVVLLAAISLQRIGYGLLLILAFSVGLAAAVTSIGLVAVTAKNLFNRVSFEGRLIRALPAGSAVLVIGLGIVMTVRALPGVLG